MRLKDAPAALYSLYINMLYKHLPTLHAKYSFGLMLIIGDWPLIARRYPRGGNPLFIRGYSVFHNK